MLQFRGGPLVLLKSCVVAAPRQWGRVTRLLTVTRGRVTRGMALFDGIEADPGRISAPGPGAPVPAPGSGRSSSARRPAEQALPDDVSSRALARWRANNSASQQALAIPADRTLAVREPQDLEPKI